MCHRRSVPGLHPSSLPACRATPALAAARAAQRDLPPWGGHLHDRGGSFLGAALAQSRWRHDGRLKLRIESLDKPKALALLRAIIVSSAVIRNKLSGGAILLFTRCVEKGG